MTTLTVKLNKRSKAGRAFMAMSESFFKGVDGVEITENKRSKKDKSPYNQEFVDEILRRVKEDKFIQIDPKNIWENNIIAN